MKRITFRVTFVALIGFSGFAFAQNLPSNPEPGKCYVKCITKDEFKDVEEQVMIKPAYSKIEVVPATFKTVEEQVLVKEASKKLIYVPAVYKTVEVPFVQKESSTTLKVIPAEFGNEVKTFEVMPVTSGWEYKTLTNCPSINKQDCVTACFVEYPSQSKDVSIVTLVKDAFVEETEVAEVESTYKQEVIDQEARVDEVEIPAQYKTIKRTVVDVEAHTKVVEVPAEYTTIVRKELVKKGGDTVWEEVDCRLLQATPIPIYYESASAKLTPASERTIDRILLPLLQGNNKSIEIMSHTDSKGNDQYNMALSQQRANSVVNYLVSKGIDRSRLAARGYGETQLINRCANGVQCSEAEHAKNRRTEFRVIGN